MPFLQNNKKEEIKKEEQEKEEQEKEEQKKKQKISDITPIDTAPRHAFNPMSSNKENRSYHGYNRRRDAVLRMDRETQQKIKAMARMSTRQLGSNMKDVIDNIVNITLSGFDDNHLEWYEAMLKQVQEEDENK